ncbi:hypothetical protein [Mycolicibacter minnesotensis]
MSITNTRFDNPAIWDEVNMIFPDAQFGLAAHIILRGLRGGTSPQEEYGRADTPGWYIGEAVGARRDTPIPLTAEQAVELVRVLNYVGDRWHPPADLLALTGWSSLHKAIENHRRRQRFGWEIVAVLDALHDAPTARLGQVREHFIAVAERTLRGYGWGEELRVA